MTDTRIEAAAKAAYIAYFGDDEDWEAFPEERAEWIDIGRAAVSAWLEAGEPDYEAAAKAHARYLGDELPPQDDIYVEVRNIVDAALGVPDEAV